MIRIPSLFWLAALLLLPFILSFRADAQARPGLHTLPGASRFPIGAVMRSELIDPAANTDNGLYRYEMANEFNLSGGENDFKMYIWHGLGDIDWSGPDKVADFARQNNMRLRGHVLLYGNVVPQWLSDGVNNGTYSDDQVRSLVHDYITAVVSRYSDIIDYWDVVNEAFDGNGNLKQDFWYQHLGPNYLSDVFNWAHQADSHAQLYYNDFGDETVNSKSNGIISTFAQLKQNGVPVTGLGLQCHFNINDGVDFNSMRQNVQNIGNQGLLFQVTELDCWVPTDNQDPNVLNGYYATQANIYRGTLDICLAQSNCQGFMMWGFTDKYSWLPGFLASQNPPINGGNGLVLDAGGYNPKPAYWALQEELAGSVADGDYKIVPRNAPSLCLSLQNDSTALSTQVVLDNYHGWFQEKWRLAKQPDGNYRITPIGDTSQCLELNGALSSPTTVDIYTSYGGSSQEWQLTPTDSGYYRLTPANNSQLCLDLYYAQNTPGTYLDTYYYTPGQDWQQFAFQAP